jgi:hypothetical protein
MARSCAIRHAAAGGLVSFLRRAAHSPFVPRKRGPTGQAYCQAFWPLQVWAPASAGANGDCCSSRIGVFSCQRAAAGGARFKAKKIGPCLHASGRGAPSFLCPHLPRVEGDGAPTRRNARIAPGGCPAAAGPWCTTVHPRLAARQRASSAYASSTLGPARSCLSLVVFSERRPWAGLRDCRPAGALPLRALRNASGRRPSTWIGIRSP